MRPRAACSRYVSPVGLLISLLMTSPLAAEPEATPTITPEAIRQLIRELGAKKAVHALVADAPRFYAMLRGIGTATPDWLSVAEQLWPGSDGYSREMLAGGLAGALEANPDGVLRLALPLAAICGYDPLTPISRPTTRDEFLRALKPREVALAGVSRPELREQKEVCLNAMTHLRETALVHQ
jgi:hypothetical protein